MRISDWSSDVCSSDLLNWLAPLRGLAFYGSAGYADAYYVHYQDAPACAVTSQCPRTNADGTTQNLSGRPLANAARWTAAAVRADERRAGQECVSTCRYWWTAYH